MDIQAEKSLLIKQLQFIDDIELIRAFKSLMEYALGKEGAEGISIEENNQDIDESEAEIKNGDIISHEDLMEEMK